MAEVTKPKRTYAIFYDFESEGGTTPKNAFTQLGGVLVCIQTSEILSTFSAYTNMKCPLGRPYAQEERCMRDFWHNPKEVDAKRLKAHQEGVQNSTQTPYEVVADFLKWVKEVSKDLDDVYLASDNVSYDGGLLRAFALEDIQYIFGKYRDLIDVSNIYYGMARIPMNTETLQLPSKVVALIAINEMRAAQKRPKVCAPKVEVKADHHPVNDATDMALYWCFIQNQLEEIDSIVEKTVTVAFSPGSLTGLGF